jgi:hypothetical protein
MSPLGLRGRDGLGMEGRRLAMLSMRPSRDLGILAI